MKTDDNSVFLIKETSHLAEKSINESYIIWINKRSILAVSLSSKRVSFILRIDVTELNKPWLYIFFIFLYSETSSMKRIRLWPFTRFTPFNTIHFWTKINFPTHSCAASTAREQKRACSQLSPSRGLSPAVQLRGLKLCTNSCQHS